MTALEAPHQPQVESLARCLNARDDAGRCQAVPVFGYGLNIQAFKEAGGHLKEPWAATLDGILRDLPLTDRRKLARVPRFNHAIYDEMHCCFGEGKKRESPRRTFLARLARDLKLQNDGGLSLKLYQDLHASEFRNILTTCVDDTFPLTIGASRRKPPGTSYEWESYRKSVFRLGGSAQPTDIWQINGSVSAPQGIRLGTFSHAAIIAELESQRIGLMNAWRTSSVRLMLPADFAQRKGPFTFNWFKQFMVFPLILIGTSLDFSDWTMWWLLHQRARIFTVFEPKDRPPTIVLTSAEDPHTHLEGNPAGIDRIEFATFDELWSTLRKLLRSGSGRTVPLRS
jgi:hypothetical protein